MLYLDLVCASVSKLCPRVSEKPKRGHKDVMINIKLDIIKHMYYHLIGYFLGGRVLKC